MAAPGGPPEGILGEIPEFLGRFLAIFGVFGGNFWRFRGLTAAGDDGKARPRPLPVALPGSVRPQGVMGKRGRAHFRWLFRIGVGFGEATPTDGENGGRGAEMAGKSLENSENPPKNPQNSRNSTETVGNVLKIP